MAILKAISPVNTTNPVSPCEVLKKETVKIVSTTTASSNKTVNFAENHNKHYENHLMDEDECRRLWHTPYDFQKMKEHNTNFIKSAIKQDRLRADDDKSYANIIKRVHETCCDCQDTLETVTEATIADSERNNSILKEQDQNAFVYLVEKANARTGLERTIVRELTYDKRTRRQQVAQAILEIQRLVPDNYKSNSTSSRSANPAKMMRVASETISLPATLFARELAIALAVSLR